MTDIKSKSQGIDPNVTSRDVKALSETTGNIYEVLSVISKRARQLSFDLKRELNQKLEEFAVSTDAIEEINENKEQIEISKLSNDATSLPTLRTPLGPIWLPPPHAMAPLKACRTRI